MKERVRLTTCIAFLCSAFVAGAASIVVPNGLAATDGNAYFQSAPFNSLNPCREMVIYDASQFGAVTPPMLVTGITLRPAGDQSTPFARTFSNVQIFLSTTAQTVAGLSSTFASNIGPNNTLVRSGSLTISTTNSPGDGTAKLFDISIPFTTAFVYNPSAGNLLIDIQNFDSGSTGLISGQAYDPGTGPTASLFFDGSATNPTGFAQPGGFIALLTVQTVPEPSTAQLLICAVALWGRRRAVRSAK